jgi:hypothetical protein
MFIVIGFGTSLCQKLCQILQLLEKSQNFGNHKTEKKETPVEGFWNCLTCVFIFFI